MIDEIQFSSMGERVTTYEQRLLATITDPSPIGALSARLIRDLGPEAGAQALAAVLDELGPGRAYVPPRCEYFRRLWSDERDRLIESMLARPDWSIGQIARYLGVGRSTVGRVAKRVRPSGRPACGYR